MKNFYEILGVSEYATTSEIVEKGRKLIKEKSVDQIFAGKQAGLDYTLEEWKEANYKQGQIIEAYQTLKDESKRADYDRKLREERRKKAQDTTYQSTSQKRTYGYTTTNPYQSSSGQSGYTTGRDQYGSAGQSGYSTTGPQYTGERQRRYRSEERRNSSAGYTGHTGYNYGANYQGSYGASGQRTTQSSYGTQGSRTAQRGYTTQNAGNSQNTQRTQRYTRTHNDGTMKRSEKRGKKPKGAFGKMIDSFKEVREEEKEYPLYERHQDLNRKVREEFHKNVKSVPGEIVYQMTNGTLHVTYEFVHQLKKLKHINDDSLPKYVFRNRKLAAAALAVALMGTIPGGDGNETIIIEQPPAIEITQETEIVDPIEEQFEVVYEEPTVTMTQYYEVVKGDTMSRISTRTGVKVYEIQEANNRVGSDKIYIGETLILNRTIDREELKFFTITVPAKGMTCRELAKMYRTDEETIKMLNKEAIAYINTGYTILTDTAVVPNFISVEEKDILKEMLSGRHN